MYLQTSSIMSRNGKMVPMPSPDFQNCDSVQVYLEPEHFLSYGSSPRDDESTAHSSEDYSGPNNSSLMNGSAPNSYELNFVVDHNANSGINNSNSGKGSKRGRKAKSDKKSVASDEMPGMLPQSRNISKVDKKPEDKPKAKIQKSYIGSCLTWIKKLYWAAIEKKSDVTELTFFVNNLINESHNHNNGSFQSTDDLKNLLESRWKKEIGGKVTIGTKRDYRISNRDSIKDKLHEVNDPKIRPLNKIILEVINFCFNNTKYYEKLIGLTCKKVDECSIEFMRKYRFQILKVFNDPESSAMKL